MDILVGGASLVVLVEILAKAVKATGKVGDGWLPLLNIVFGAGIAYVANVTGFGTGPAINAIVLGVFAGAAASGFYDLRDKAGLKF